MEFCVTCVSIFILFSSNPRGPARRLHGLAVVNQSTILSFKRYWKVSYILLLLNIHIPIPFFWGFLDKFWDLGELRNGLGKLRPWRSLYIWYKILLIKFIFLTQCRSWGRLYNTLNYYLTTRFYTSGPWI